MTVPLNSDDQHESAHTGRRDGNAGGAPTDPRAGASITLRAYAKVNLCLAVAPPQPPGSARPGWHQIASWFHAIDLWDDVEIRANAGPSVSRGWAGDAPRATPIDWPEEQDLAVRAHRLMETLAGRALPIALRLTKRVPTGGGLGGGSSDAAAVMRGVNAVFSLGIDAATLRRASARLGSDVAYFIPESDRDPRRAPPDAGISPLAPPAPALVAGFGDRIAPAARATGEITLVLPEFGCATPAVYRAFDALDGRPFRDEQVVALAADPARNADPRTLDDALFNDLAPAAESVEPRLAQLRRALAGGGRRVHITGSGSTLFLLGGPPADAPEGPTLVRTRLV